MQNQKKFPHQRKDERIQLEGRVFIHDDDHLYIAPLYNVSAGGVYVNKLVSLKTGCLVRVVIKSGKLGTAIQAKGRIVRVEKNGRTGSAVEFDSLGQEYKSAIERYLSQNREEEALQVA